MIPKLVHRIWFGKKPIPENYEAWWQAWQRQWPDHEFVTWTDADIPRLPRVEKQIRNGRNFAEKSDIARYEILRQFGGIYLDCDLMPLHELDIQATGADLVRNPSIYEELTNIYGEALNVWGCGNEFFAAVPGHPALEAAVAEIEQLDLDPDAEVVDTVMVTGPIMWARVVHGQGLELPHKVISPYSYEEPFSVMYERDLSSAHAVHVWGNSWLPPDFQQQKLDSMWQYGDLRAIEAVLPKTAIGQAEYDRDIQHLIALRNARHNIAEMVIHSSNINELLLTPLNPLLFQPFKVFQFLGDSRQPFGGPFAVLQLGAEHLAMARALRPILVNFEPKTRLVTHDEAAAEHLGSRYGRNQQLSVEAGPFVLPEGAEELEALVLSTPQDNPRLFDQLLAEGRQPRLMIISHDGFSPEAYDELYGRVPAYRVFQFDGYCCAYRKDWFLSYCSYLFIDYGIPTIFAGLAGAVFAQKRPKA